MPGWLSSAGSGPLTWMLSNATSIAWISQHQRKGRQGEDDAAQTANVAKEKRNENQIDQRIRGRPGQGPALLYAGTGLCQEGRFQSGPISLADRGLVRRAGRHGAAAGAERQPRGQSISAGDVSTGPARGHVLHRRRQGRLRADQGPRRRVHHATHRRDRLDHCDAEGHLRQPHSAHPAGTLFTLGGGCLAGSVPSVLVRSRRCSRTPPRPHGSVNTNERETQAEGAAAKIANQRRRKEMKIKVTSLYVDDQDKALRFYTEVLDFAKKTDFSQDPYRWLTVASPEEPDGTELQLALNNNPAAKAYQQALFQQSQPAAMFFSDDVQAEYERMKGRGAEFTMPPTDVTASKISMLKDTCGNLIQITELKRW